MFNLFAEIISKKCDEIDRDIIHSGISQNKQLQLRSIRAKKREYVVVFNLLKSLLRNVMKLIETLIIQEFPPKIQSSWQN